MPGLDGFPVVEFNAHEFHVVAGFALAAALIVAGLLFSPDATPGRIDAVSSVTLSIYLLATALIALASRHDPFVLTTFTLLVVAALGIAFRAEATTAVVPAAAALCALVIIRWAFDVELARLIAPSGIGGAAVRCTPALARISRSSQPTLCCSAPRASFARPVLWSAAAVAGPIAIVVALYARIAGLKRSIPFAGVALLMEALYGIATKMLSKREQRPGMDATTALFATGSVSCLALALTFALEKGWLTVALALMVPGIAWILQQRPLPMLRWLAAIIAELLAARIGWEPRIVGSDVGTTPIFNWLLYGYGVPAVSFWIAERMMRRQADDKPTRIVESAAILITVLLAFLEIHHLSRGGDIYRAACDLH